MIDTPSSNLSHPTAWGLIAAVIIGGGFYLYGKNIDQHASSNSPFLVSVSADAKVYGAPDIATASFGVQTGRQSTAKAAMELVKKNMTNVLAAVKKAGVADKDITTQSFWLSPVYDYVNGSQVPRGYEANQSLSVKIRDLDTIGEVLTAATSAGANQAGGIDFSIDNPDSLSAEARTQAIAKAKVKVQELADSLGMEIVKLTNFSEGSGYPQPRVMMMDSKSTAGFGGEAIAPSVVPVPVGEQEISSTVTLTYELR
jgi:hypothetical protein